MFALITWHIWRLKLVDKYLYMGEPYSSDRSMYILRCHFITSFDYLIRSHSTLS